MSSISFPPTAPLVSAPSVSSSIAPAVPAAPMSILVPSHHLPAAPAAPAAPPAAPAPAHPSPPPAPLPPPLLPPPPAHLQPVSFPFSFNAKPPILILIDSLHFIWAQSSFLACCCHHCLPLHCHHLFLLHVAHLTLLGQSITLVLLTPLICSALPVQHFIGLMNVLPTLQELILDLACAATVARSLFPLSSLFLQSYIAFSLTMMIQEQSHFMTIFAITTTLWQ